MTPYNTGNPLGSTDFRDLSDNARNFDYFANGSSPAYPDRFGGLKLSIEGMNQAFNSAQAGRQAQFEAVLASIGFTSIGDYGAGVTFTTRQQYVVRAGAAYAVANDTTLPFTLTGTWADDLPKLKLINSDSILRSDLMSTDGATLVMTSNGMTVEERLSALPRFVSPMMHGAAGDNVTDDAAALNAAWADAKAQRANLVIDRPYAASHCDFDATNGVRIVGSGSITGLSSGAYPSVVSMKNGADLVIDGRLVISAGFNEGYECGVHCYSDNAGGFSKFFFYNLTVVGAKLGYRFGISTNPDTFTSEFSLYGSFTYGCPTCYEFVGNQLVGSLIGVQAITGVEGVPSEKLATWNNFPRTAIRAFGANVKQIGGSALITGPTTGLLYDIQPIVGVDVNIGNRYGSIIAIGVDIESASAVAQIRNPAAIPNIVQNAGCFQMTACSGYHSQDTQPIISSYDDFAGYVDVRYNPNFNTPTPRTQPTVQLGASRAHLFADETCFGVNFKQSMAGYLGGILHFGRQPVLIANNLGGESVPVGTPTPLKFTVAPTSAPCNARYGAGLTAAGRFNAPIGGLKDVVVHLNVDILAERPNSVISARVNGTTFRGYVGTEAGRYVNAQLNVGDLAEGEWLELMITTASPTTAFSFASSSQDGVVISARR